MFTTNAQTSFEPCDFYNYMYNDLKLLRLNSKHLFVATDIILYEKDVLRLIPDSILQKNPSTFKFMSFDKTKCACLKDKLINSNDFLDKKIPLELDSLGIEIEKKLNAFNLLPPTPENWEARSNFQVSPEYNHLLKQELYQIPRILFFQDLIVVNEDYIIGFLSYSYSSQRSAEVAHKIYLFKRNSKKYAWEYSVVEIM